MTPLPNVPCGANLPQIENYCLRVRDNQDNSGTYCGYQETRLFLRIPEKLIKRGELKGSNIIIISDSDNNNNSQLKLAGFVGSHD